MSFHRIIGAIVFASSLASQAQTIEDPPYVPAHQVAGAIRICGSPQMADLLHLYESGFHKLQPAVEFKEDLQSTITAVSGVSSGKADIGLLGRELWPAEAAAFTLINGHAPTVIDIATGSFDVPKATFALMIFVPRANPIASLSIQQLARIFSSSSDIKTWGDLGLTGDWATRPIHLYGFTTDNDKSRIFAGLIFTNNQHWTPALHPFANAPDGADAGQLIVNAVAVDPNAIGISNVHYATPAVRVLPLSAPDPIAPTKENVATRRYPLTRAVYMVVDSPNPAAIEFLRFVLSHDGQQAVLQEGNYLPLPPAVIAAELRKLH